MSVKLIQEKLIAYKCKSELEENHALREISQEVILAALGRGDFFNFASFHGGTCLRIFYGLNRFSEDLDFVLTKPNTEFNINHYLQKVVDECNAFGYKIEIQDRSKKANNIKQAFSKDKSLGKILQLNYSGKTGRMSNIRIKFEIDTNPPQKANSEMKYLDFPFVSMVNIHDKPSLFAGKIHALLCRSYTKGRDWYDFIWYTSQNIKINYDFLSTSINQQGPWQGKVIIVDKKWCKNELSKKIESLDWEIVTNDVRRFIRDFELPSLKLWSKELFLHQLSKII